MPLLFFISGFTLSLKFPCEDVFLFLKKKFIRLGIPYLFWAHVILFIRICLCSIQIDFLGYMQEIYGSAFWFLRHLLAYFLIIGLCQLSSKKLFHNHYLKLHIFLSVFVVWFLGDSAISSVCFSGWFYCWLIFGIVVGKVREYGVKQTTNFNENLRKWIVIVCACVMCLTIALYFLTSWNEKIIAVLMVSSITGFLYNITDKIPEFIQNSIVSAGKNSLAIYATHYCLLFMPSCLGYKMQLIYKYDWWLRVIVLTCAWLLICVLIIMVVNKNKYARLLFWGEK